MKQQIERYLAEVEKGLKALDPSERADIITEIKSHIGEKQADRNLTTEEILADLGDPRALARGYVGDTVAKRKSTSFSQAMRLAAFYGVTGLHGSVVIPTLAITAWTFYLCAVIVVGCAVVQTVAWLFGYRLPLLFQFGAWALPTQIAVPLGLAAAWLLYVGGKKLWALLKTYLARISHQRQAISSQK